MAVHGPQGAQHASRGWPVVEWRARDNRGRLRVLPGPGVVVGRHVDADLSLDDPGLSRRHALLICEPDRMLKIVDLRSGNGTYVNGTRVHVAMLVEGDVVQLADAATLRVRYPLVTWRSLLGDVVRKLARWSRRVASRTDALLP